jgi:transposase
LSLGDGERVLLAFGQVRESGGVDGVGALRAPDGSPGRQPQSGAALPGQRIDCRSCTRVRTEQVSWGRPNARHTTDFENVVAWLAQRMDKASIARLLRCSWEAVDAIVTRVVADHIDDARLDRLYRIGVDEISYKRGHKFLTIVADHDTGNVASVPGVTRPVVRGHCPDG